jgi:hypothetical protein
MSDEQDFSIRDFGASFKGFMEKVAAAAPTEEPFFAKRLREHFDGDASLLPTLSESFAPSDHANVQVALDALLEGVAFDLVGFVSEHPGFGGTNFAQLLTGGRFGSAPNQGPVEYVNLRVGDGEVIGCVQRGLYLVRGEHPLAFLLRGPDHYGMERSVSIDVMARNKGEAEEFLARLRKSMRARNIYRGRIVSLSFEEHGGVRVAFHRLRNVERNDIILPAGVLDRVERHSTQFTAAADKLRQAGRHLKRGLLLYGPPGTGKTLTAMYIAGQSRDRTVILLTGRSLGLIEQSCAMARALQPATIIIEDVDLVAEERTSSNACTVVLFELLNQMDGLADDADILFVLTTNRPDILEPALAARPGRVDQAIEIPLPDEENRRRLFELYGNGLNLELHDLDTFVKRTAGGSAAFIRELLRRAALIAADEPGPIQVKDRHVDEALHELVVSGGELTQSLLGAKAKG